MAYCISLTHLIIFNSQALIKRYVLLCPRGVWFSLYNLREAVDEGFMVELLSTLAERQRGSFVDAGGNGATLVGERRSQRGASVELTGMEKDEA